MEQEKILQSLEDIIKDISPDYLILDTSVLGANFLNGNRDVHLNSAYGRDKNLQDSEIRLYLHSTVESINFLERHKNTIVPSEVIKEFERGLRLVTDCATNFGDVRGFTKRRPIQRKSKGEMKTIKKLERIGNLYQAILEEINKRVIDERVIDERDYTEELYLEELSKSLITATDRNPNNEKIMFASMLYGIRNKSHVALITKNKRFNEILSFIKRNLDISREYSRNIAEFLEEGKMNIVFGDKNGFKAQCRSSDYIS